jgi:hypothetical protein
MSVDDVASEWGKEKFEIGRFLHLKSRNPKSQIGLSCSGAPSNLKFRISGFEMQDSSDFEFLPSAPAADIMAR